MMPDLANEWQRPFESHGVKYRFGRILPVLLKQGVEDKRPKKTTPEQR